MLAPLPPRAAEEPCQPAASRIEISTCTCQLGSADGALGIIGTTAPSMSARVPLPKHPEPFQLEQSGNRLLVNVPDAKQVNVIGREERSLLETWPMEQFQANSPMALPCADELLRLWR